METRQVLNATFLKGVRHCCLCIHEQHIVELNLFDTGSLCWICLKGNVWGLS